MLIEYFNFKQIFVIGNKGENGLIRPCPDLLVRSISEVHSPVNFV